MKRRLFVQQICTAALVFTLSSSMVVPVFADGVDAVSQQENIAQASSIGSVYISNNSYFQLEQASVLPGDDGKIVTFKVKLHNGDNADISFIDYWVRLQTTSGTQFSVNLLPKDKDKNRVPAGSEETINFYAKVSAATNLQDLVFKFIKWDFAAVNFERNVGNITVPWDYSQLTLADEKRIVNVGGTQLKSSISKVMVNKNEDNYWVSLSYALDNIGSKSALLSGYTFAIRTPEGLLYPLDGTAAKDLTIFPRAVKEVKLTGTIPATVSQEGWELVVTELEPTAKIQLPVAFYQLPGSTTDDASTPVTGSKIVEINDKPLAISMGRVSMNKNDVNYQTTVYMKLENQGNESILVPNYELVIRTSEGISYPATAKGLKDLTILPRSSKEIQLSVNIPLSVNVDKLELVVNQPAAAGGSTGGTGGGSGSTATDSRFRYPVAVFELPAPTQNEGYMGTTSEFSNKNGVYGITFNSMQRLPWEENDILTADLSLLNKGSSALPIPALTGYFLLDGTIKVPAKLVQTDSVISLAGQENVGFQLYGSIPYTYAYSNVKLVVQEKVSDTEMNDLVEFKNENTAVSMPHVAFNEGYKIDAIGRKSGLSIRSSRHYSGVDFSLFAVQLSVENLEKRFTNVSKLVGYFKTKDDLMFPATISEVKKKISPLGKAIVYVTTNLPVNYDTTDIELILGEGVKDNKLAEGAAVPDAYINGVTFAIPGETQKVQEDFNKMELFPYVLSINKVGATAVQNDKFSFTFDYTLNKNAFAEYSGEEHKVVLEFTDVTGSIAFTETFTLDKSADNAVAGNLAVGQYTKTFIKNDPAFLAKIPYLSQYKINVYDQFLGVKKLMATRTINWFVTSE